MEWGGGVMNWAIGIDMYTLMCMKWMTNKNLLYKNMNKIKFKKKQNRGFPGGAVVGSLPANAGDAGSSPGLGRSHMPQSGWAREPQLLSLRVWSCAPQQEGPRW